MKKKKCSSDTAQNVKFSIVKLKDGSKSHNMTNSRIILQSNWTHIFHISMWGFSAPTRTSRVTIWLRQEGNFVQHILVSQCWFRLLEFDHSQIVLNIFKYSITLEKGFLMIILTIMFKLWLHPDSFAKGMTSSTGRGCSFVSRLPRPRIITQKLF